MTLRRAGKTSVFLALASALALLFALAAPTTGAAREEVTLSISVGSTGFQPVTAGSACAELQVSQVFPVDVRVENVDDLMAYELRVTYDSTVLALEDADFEHFLVSTPPNGQVFPSLFEAESANSYFLAAADTRGSSDSGSGILARLQMRAIGEGVSEISIQTDPTVYGPRLTNDKGKPIADDTGDGIFDGKVLNGTAAVNENCSDTGGEDPPSSDTEPDGAGDDPRPGTGAGPQTDTEGGTAGSDDVSNVSIDIVGGGSQDGETADTTGAEDSVTGARSDSEDGDGSPADEGTTTDDSGLTGATNAGDSSADGSSAGLLWYALIALAALVVLATLGLAVKALRAP